MWKIVLGFIIFAALSLFIINKGGDKLDMSGEKHGAEATEAHEAPASAPVVAPSAAQPAPAPASAASTPAT